MLKTEQRHFERAVREALEIQRHRSAPRFGGMNKDEGQYLKSTFWMPYTDMVSKEEKERNECRQRGNEQRLMAPDITSPYLTSNYGDTLRNPPSSLR